MKKKIVGFLVCMLLITTILPITVSSDYSSNNIIYVDDDNIDGPWDGTQEHPYKYIQDAINNSIDGDTVFVYNGTYLLGDYSDEGTIFVNNSIKLIGESRDGTIITSNTLSQLHLTKSNVSIINFTFENCTIFCMPGSVDEPNICNIEISNNRLFTIFGLAIIKSNNVKINENIFLPLHEKIGFGIMSLFNSKVNIENNKISGFMYGIWCSNGDVVENNLIQDNHIAIQPLAGSFSPPCVVRNNNFINNEIHAYFNFAYSSKISSYLPSNIKNHLTNELSFNNLQSSKNKIISQYITWDGNYWDNWIGIGPKFIFGGIFFFRPYIPLPMVNLDWNPAKEPYNIPIAEGVL